MKKYLEGFADYFDYDNLGSLIAVKKGDSDLRVMLSGHIDEVGFIVSFIIVARRRRELPTVARRRQKARRFCFRCIRTFQDGDGRGPYGKCVFPSA